jgi:hypothetical protein
LDGNSHVIYAEEEAGGTRLQINGKTCLLQVNTLFFFFMFLVSIGQLPPDFSVSFIIAFPSTTLPLKGGFCCLLLQETSPKKIVTHPCFLAE